MLRQSALKVNKSRHEKAVFSATVQADWCRTWSKHPKIGFSYDTVQVDYYHLKTILELNASYVLRRIIHMLRYLLTENKIYHKQSQFQFCSPFCTGNIYQATYFPELQTKLNSHRNQL